MAGLYRDMLPQNELRPSMRNDLRVDPGLPHNKELTGLCRTHHLINFLTDTYITTQLASFSLAGGDGTPATASLSRPERQRITRAFYRRQILSNGWALALRPPVPTSEDLDVRGLHDASTEPGRRLGLLAHFAPWDMQQVDHANDFIERLCPALVRRAAEAATQGRGAEITPRQLGDLYAHLGCLVDYLRVHGDVALAAMDDLQSGRSPLEGGEVGGESGVLRSVPVRARLARGPTVRVLAFGF